MPAGAAYCDCIDDGQASLSIYFGLCCQQTWGSGAGEISSLRSCSSGTSGSESEQKNITVNAICPGYLDTEMTQSSIANIVEKTGLSSEQAAEKLHSFSPQKRLFTADEVAQAALYLASPAASGINGQALSIDGEKPGNTSVTSFQYFP